MATQTHAHAARSGRGSLREQVAAEVRAEMARQRMSGVKMAGALGQTQGWISRRLSGRVAFDVDDLEVVARTLGMNVEVLLSRGPRSSVGLLPHLDSNQKPTVSRRDGSATPVAETRELARVLPFPRRQD